MTNSIGVADHPEKKLMERLWKQGFRAKGILEYLEENGLPDVSYKALSKYGQRNWTEESDVETTEEKTSNSNLDLLIDELDKLDIGKVERISVSKTGFNISMRPLTDVSELKDLPKAKVGQPVKKKNRKPNRTKTHVVIPDTQLDPGRGNDHLVWVSNFLKEEFSGEEIVLVHLGDHWNMGSLSSYDKGKGVMEGRRFVADIEAGNRGFELLNSAIASEPFEKHFLFGNHENRISKMVEYDIKLEGVVGLENCITPPGWERHGFLEPVTIDGVTYCHYFYNPNTGKPYGGNIDLRLRNIGHSFVMGHQQGLATAQRYDANGNQICGVVAGSCYTHDEEYRGPQANTHWNGILVLNNVEDGAFDPWPISLDYLCKIYEGKPLSEHTPEVL